MATHQVLPTLRFGDISHAPGRHGIAVAFHRGPRAGMQMISIHRCRWRHLAWGVVIALASVSAASGKVDRRHPGKVSEKVLSEANRRDANKVDVLVRFRRAPGAPERMLINAFSGKLRRELQSSSQWM